MEENTNKFDHRLKAPEPHIVALLAQIDGIRGEFKSGLRMTPQMIMSLKKSTLITSAGASTRIEGSKLDDGEVQKILQGLAVSKFADRDSQEVQGYLEALQNVFEGYQVLPLRESTIQSLHKALLTYSVKDEFQRGHYKKRENMVGAFDESGKMLKVIFETTPAYLTAKEMQELVEWTHEALEQKRFHPLLVIANFIVEFLKIHPFEDGNGRLSRVLTNLLLLQSGYQFVQYVSHEQVIEQRKDHYYVALRKSQETFGTNQDSISSWLNFFLPVVQVQATKALGYLEDEHMEDSLSPKQLLVWKYLTEVGEASPSEIVAGTDVVMATVRQALERLLEIGKVKRTGRGRGTRYVKL